MEMVGEMLPPEPGRGYVGIPPRRPSPPDTRKTSHGLHLALTIVLVLITLFTIGWLWLFVWLFVAIVNDEHNRRERRRFEREMVEWQRAYLEWEHGAFRVLGYVPQLPPGW
jgi:hypothetical protein